MTTTPAPSSAATATASSASAAPATTTSATSAASTTADATASPASTGGAAPDPRPAFAAALDQATRLIGLVTPADLDLPTPCTEYDVRDIVGHLVAVARRVTHIAHGGQPYDVSSLVTDVDDTGWLEAWQTHRATVDEAMAEDGVLDRVFAHPAGDFPGRQAVFAYVSEVLVHGWDLAAALGRRDLLDDALAEGALAPVQQFLPAEPRGGRIPFGPVVEVATDGADATAYDRLVAWMGRDPRWTP